LFVAGDLDSETRTACADVAQRLRSKRFAAKWVTPENYHLTVAFIGGVDEERVGAVRAALEETVTRLAPLEVPLDAVGAFPNERRARIAWVGSHRPVPEFATLCGAVRSALSELGFTFDRHADAHVTLARAEGRAALPSVAPPAIAPVRLDSLTLYRSFTEHGGARYEPVERFRFGGGATSPPAARPSF
jgi:2'-5' RNA ligase